MSVASGLREGERVVSRGAERLRDGQDWPGDWTMAQPARDLRGSSGRGGRGRQQGLPPGRGRGAGPGRGRPGGGAGRLGGHHGPERVGQVDPARAARGAGPADLGDAAVRRADVTGLSEDELAAVRNQVVGFVFQNFQLLARTPAVGNVGLPLVYRGLGRSSGGGWPPRRSSRSGSGTGSSTGPPSSRGRAAAGGHRPRPGHRAGDAAGRRAHRQPRLALGRRGAGPPLPPPRRTRGRRGGGHPRPGGRGRFRRRVTLRDGRLASETEPAR